MILMEMHMFPHRRLYECNSWTRLVIYHYCVAGKLDSTIRAVLRYGSNQLFWTVHVRPRPGCSGMFSIFQTSSKRIDRTLYKEDRSMAVDLRTVLSGCVFWHSRDSCSGDGAGNV